MSERYTRRSALLCRLEAPYGTPVTIFGESDAILLVDPPQFLIEADNVPRNLVMPWMGNSEELPATRRAKLTFKVELAGSGAAGTPPAWGKLLRACGFSETIVAGASVTYAPVNDGFEGMTFRFFRDGVRYLAKGGRGTVKLTLDAYAIPTAEFEFWAFDAQALAASIPAINLAAFIQPQVVTDANSGDIWLGASVTGGVVSGGAFLASKGISWDIGNKLAHRKMLRGERIAITDRSVTGKMAVELSAADEIIWRDAINANTLAAMSFTHGVGAGNLITVHAGRVQRTNPQAIDDDGSVLIQTDLRALPSVSGNPEFMIVAR
ncbi:phage tail tube protein [Paracoccaceae bacterium Fryx2]|nr:phage tail tube protein [Paracoccaceae bacterium Fryx2]